MKKKSKIEMDDDLRPEYDFKKLLKNGVQGKYAARCREGTNIVLLDPEVARAFPDESTVNEALRLVIQLSHLSTASKKPSARSRTAKNRP